MIAIPKPAKTRLSRADQQRFMQMLPIVTKMASAAARRLDPEGRQEFVAEVVAHALLMLARLKGAPNREPPK